MIKHNNLVHLLVLTTAIFIGAIQPRICHSSPLIVRGSNLLIKALTKSHRALSALKIKELSKLALRPKGTRLVGKALAKMRLPSEVLEDSYLRIAVAQGKVRPTKAASWFRSLRGTPGFRSALSKSIGQSAVKAKGHLNELAIAAQSRVRGLKVIGIGKSFNDPAKKGLTDIDLVLRSNQKTLAVEAKDYLPTTRLPMDQFRSDLNTLTTYCAQQKSCIPVFSITHRPSNINDLTRLTAEAKKRGVQLVIGDPASLSEHLKLFGEIL